MKMVLTETDMEMGLPTEMTIVLMEVETIIQDVVLLTAQATDPIREDLIQEEMEAVHLMDQDLLHMEEEIVHTGIRRVMRTVTHKMVHHVRMVQTTVMAEKLTTIIHGVTRLPVVEEMSQPAALHHPVVLHQTDVQPEQMMTEQKNHHLHQDAKLQDPQVVKQLHGTGKYCNFYLNKREFPAYFYSSVIT